MHPREIDVLQMQVDMACSGRTPIVSSTKSARVLLLDFSVTLEVGRSNCHPTDLHRAYRSVRLTRTLENILSYTLMSHKGAWIFMHLAAPPAIQPIAFNIRGSRASGAKRILRYTLFLHLSGTIMIVAKSVPHVFKVLCLNMTSSLV